MKTNDINIMCDLETLGVGSNSVVISGAFIAFNVSNGTILGELEIVFNLNQQIKTGGVIDGDAIEFHLGQSAESLAYMAKRDKLAVSDALDKINDFIRTHNATAIWGNGATFDCVILRNLFTRHLKVLDLPFWTDRDLRTAVDIYNIDTKQVEFTGTRHYCIDDARHQIKILTDKTVRNSI